MTKLYFTNNQSKLVDIHTHLKECSDNFPTPLDSRVNLDQYSQKLFLHSKRFECWSDCKLVGLVAAYIECEKSRSFITNVTVSKDFYGKSIGKTLLLQLIDYCRVLEIRVIELDVEAINGYALKIYSYLGFFISEQKDNNFIRLKIELSR